MLVRDLIDWLKAFPDQDATVEVIRHTSGRGWDDQGGNASTVTFDPAAFSEYTDLRGNPHIKPDASYFNARTLLLGEIDG